jgi:branched-chain amino acid aminotransferase
MSTTSYSGWSADKFHAVYDGSTWSKSASEPVIPVSASCVQYAQSVIEGMKAYKTGNGKPVVFRLHAHHERLQYSLKRLNLPPIDPDFFYAALKTVVTPASQWESPLTSDILYIRPIVYGLEGDIFPVASKKCGFSIYTAPVGNFRKEHCTIQFFNLLTRTSEHGLNSAKTSLNYAPIISKPAKEKPATDVWFDPVTGYIEEADTSNIFFVIRDLGIITPILNSRILAGITRNSVIEIIKQEMPYQLIEQNITVQEILEFSRAGRLVDCFMTSTGIGIQHVNDIYFDQQHFPVTAPNSVANELYIKYTDAIFGSNQRYSSWRDSL